MKKLIIITFCLLSFLMMQSCASITVQRAEIKQIREISKGTDVKPIQFRRIVVKMRRGEPMGQAFVGVFCIPREKLEWRGGRLNMDDEFTEVFREQLIKANYPVVGDPNALFEDPSTWKAELFVAALISRIETNACFPSAGFGNWNTLKGGTFIRVNWQIYGQLERKVIYEVTTEGSYQTDEVRSGGIAAFMSNAFAAATQNLLADQGFYNLVTKNKPSSTLPEPTYQTIEIDKPPKEPRNISDVRAAAVTVFAGLGHGSGFIITKSGYVITNEHVVKSARFVKVKLANGREIFGDVVRSDPSRDVALIKLAESNLPYMSLRLATAPNVGEEVFAIGSPFSEKLDVSVTKGIISAYRDESGLKYIQSDVQVHPGNSGGALVDKNGDVVGITAMAYMKGGVSQNLNFFVPISEVVSRLRITFK